MSKELVRTLRFFPAMFRLRGLVDRLQFYVITRKKIRNLFKNKSIAIVGNSPCILAQGLGTKIDSYDMVVRLNLVRSKGLEKDLGSRTDFRIIGATMLNKHIKYIQGLPEHETIITTAKNSSIMKALGKSCLYYPSDTPSFALALLCDILDHNKITLSDIKPPKTGLVFLSLLLRFGATRGIALFGFSLVKSNSGNAIDFSRNGVREYDVIKYGQNHCDPTIEIGILRSLEMKGCIEIH